MHSPTTKQTYCNTENVLVRIYNFIEWYVTHFYTRISPVRKNKHMQTYNSGLVFTKLFRIRIKIRLKFQNE